MQSPITKKQRVRDYLSARAWTKIGESEWNEIRAALPDVSDTVIRNAGLPVDAPWCGIHQHTFEELEQSLREFSRICEQRPDLRRLCRREVISAKDRAKWLSGKHHHKAEMAEWMLVWLSDPALFPVWVDALHASRGLPDSMSGGGG